MTQSIFLTFVSLFFLWARLQAVTITGYSPEANDRFVSGFPTAPVENTNANFVGLGYDWSGVGWSTTTFASSSFKGLGLLSPQHFLTAQHYEYSTANEDTKGLRVLNQQGNVTTSSPVSGVSNTGQGLVLTNHTITNPDVAIGTLSVPLARPNTIARMGVLDLHNSSGADTLSNYNNLQVFLYGRSNTTNGSPRIGSTTVDLAFQNGADPNQLVFRTVRSGQVQLQAGDSGAPALHGWQNPNGGNELAVVGVNSAINDTYNFVSMLSTTAAMAATNNIMTQDGFALRVVGNPGNTWQGSTTGQPGTGAQLVRPQNWSGNSTPNDTYVLFDAGGTTVRALNVNDNIFLRGLYFRETGSSTDGFTFGGTSTLTIGRGGITNYDIARQVFTAPITLGDHQYWDVGQGGVTIANLNTNGRLLEIAGAGTARLNGTVSGSGGLAVSGARVEVMGTNTYTGNTWVHSGVLNVDGSLSSSSQVRIGADGRLEGSGSVGAISGSGSVDPGNSPGILTATSVDPGGGLSFNFEFTSTGSPDYGSANASLNDVLRLTGPIPFASEMTAANQINVFLDVPALAVDQAFRGGFYTDNDADFLSFIQNATFSWHLADANGAVLYNNLAFSLYTGPLSFQLSTVSEQANFGSGTIEGQVMQFVVIPEPGTLILFGLTGIAAGLGLWGRRRQKVC